MASRSVARIAAYAWTSPNTLVGMAAGLVVLAFGGRARVVRGCVEFSGGRMASLVSRAPPSCAFVAITLGHAILGLSEATLDAVRDHEHVHVAQYEAWGPLFAFAYACSSVWQVVRGRRAYRDNVFERQAYARSSCDRLASAVIVDPRGRPSGR